MGCEGIIPTLENRKIRYSESTVFDDSSECSFKYVRPTKEMIKRKMSDSDFLSNITPEQRAFILKFPKKCKRAMKQAAGISSQKGSAIDLKRELRRRFCIGCFTITPKSVAMWEKYAKGYSGCALQFRFERKANFHWINYSDKLPPYNDAFCFDDGIHFMKIICHKRKRYDWEQEVRYVVSRDIMQCIGGVDVTPFANHVDLSFKPSELQAVYIGKSISLADEQEIMRLLSCDDMQHVKIFKMDNSETPGTLGINFITIR